VLGGGSNLVIADRGWPGLVLRIALRGTSVEDRGDDGKFYAAAGESWDQFVALTVSKNYAGLECMSGIPGAVGGTPVQNVGAYGQDVSQTITRVRVLDQLTGEIRELSNGECEFGYRTSIFNTREGGRYIVLRVGYDLRANGSPTIHYADLEKFFSNASTPPTLDQVRRAVLQIRHSKAMVLLEGDENSRSVGSFFKNPVVSRSVAARVERLAQQRALNTNLPVYPAADGQVKLPAAWLVEQSGFLKGYTRGSVGISRKHALAFVNRGGATAKDIIALKNEVQHKVRELWGICLQPEPVFAGFRPEEVEAGSLQPRA
jgi:UDP-N-acetylmuramate dehydrogenase